MTAPLGVAVSVRPHRRPDEGAAAALVMPLDGPMIDRYGRVHSDLRLSVTDRCNLRCVYCMPEEGLSFLPQRELLTFDEITRVARMARSLGITSLRLTGLARIDKSTPDSASAEIAGEAMAEALSATTKLNMNMNKMSACGIAVLTSPEVMLAL